MPRVSVNREINRGKQYLFIDDFYSAITSLKDKAEVRAFFEDLLTEEEKLMYAKRFQVIMMLRLNYLWRDIDERVKITHRGISDISTRITSSEGGLIKVVQRIIDLKKKRIKTKR